WSGWLGTESLASGIVVGMGLAMMAVAIAQCRKPEYPSPATAEMDRARSAGLRMRRTKRATPGGYGGKPPGVAFIGAPTGARNAGNGAPAGDQSTGKHVTPNRPHVRQDRIRSESADHS